MIRAKLTCYTPKGKAEASSKGFGMKLFSGLNRPKETVIVSDREFYYIYDFEDEKKFKKFCNKIPKAEQKIRMFYTVLFHVIGRANKMGKKGAWKLEKIRRWILKRLVKKGYDKKTMDDFIDGINIEDEKEMREFLGGELFRCDIMETE